MAITVAAATLISLEEYLATSYRPDCEYIDGEVRERSIGKRDHARLQALLAIWFGSREAEWGLMVYTEWRTKVSATRVRIPDVVLVLDEEQPDVLTDSPVLSLKSCRPMIATRTLRNVLPTTAEWVSERCGSSIQRRAPVNTVSATCGRRRSVYRFLAHRSTLISMLCSTSLTANGPR